MGDEFVVLDRVLNLISPCGNEEEAKFCESRINDGALSPVALTWYLLASRNEVSWHDSELLRQNGAEKVAITSKSDAAMLSELAREIFINNMITPEDAYRRAELFLQYKHAKKTWVKPSPPYEDLTVTTQGFCGVGPVVKEETVKTGGTNAAGKIKHKLRFKRVTEPPAGWELFRGFSVGYICYNVKEPCITCWSHDGDASVNALTVAAADRLMKTYQGSITHEGWYVEWFDRGKNRVPPPTVDDIRLPRYTLHFCSNSRWTIFDNWNWKVLEEEWVDDAPAKIALAQWNNGECGEPEVDFPQLKWKVIDAPATKEETVNGN